MDNDHCIKFNNAYYKTMDSNGYPVYYRKVTSGMVLKAYDGQMFFCVEERVYALDVIPEHANTSKNFDTSPVQEKLRERYIPPMSHTRK